jgi:hypothetical protein
VTTPYPVVKRIPEDQPFVVRPNRAKRLRFLGLGTGVIALFLLCLFGVVFAGEDAGPGVFLALWLGVTAFFFVGVGAIMWFQTSGGPVLAAGPAGLWIKTRPTRGQAIWLPWESIGLIDRRQWYFEKMLVVHPREQGLGDKLGVLTAIDSAIVSARQGSGLTATLTFADRNEAEILQAVAYFAAGRVPLA